ncbi:MAG: L-seryl-tRNA(Sec) selenium transferase [Gemmatimonadota bacterium]
MSQASRFEPRRSLPGVDRLLASPPFAGLLLEYGSPEVVRHLRAALDDLRRALGQGATAVPDAEGWAERVQARLQSEARAGLLPVINATGVILHTNLGRAVLSDAARRALDGVAGTYSALEYDLESGTRGGRATGVRSLLARLAGAEDALVVNNAAAALVLSVAALARGQAVVVGRGELIEIGGRFRIPEVVEAAGTPLLEVGTTNRTRLRDYEAALRRGEVGAILKVHPSNFRMEGFVEEAGLAELVELGGRFGVPVVHDLGTGALVDLGGAGVPDEPRVQDAVRAGPALVVFSGDKLLGGPQAGMLVGWREAVAAAARHPLARAVRSNKLTLAALEATLRHYRDSSEAWRQIPTLRMIAEPPDHVALRVDALVKRLAGRGIGARAQPCASVVGGGTLPGAELESHALALDGGEALARLLRRGAPPVVARIEGERVLLDLRTVAAEQEDALVEVLVAALTGFQPSA